MTRLCGHVTQCIPLRPFLQRRCVVAGYTRAVPAPTRGCDCPHSADGGDETRERMRLLEVMALHACSRLYLETEALTPVTLRGKCWQDDSNMVAGAPDQNLRCGLNTGLPLTMRSWHIIPSLLTLSPAMDEVVLPHTRCRSFDGIPRRGLRWSGYLAFTKHVHGDEPSHRLPYPNSSGRLAMTQLIFQIEKQKLGGVRDWLTCPRDPKLLKYGNKIRSRSSSSHQAATS